MNSNNNENNEFKKYCKKSYELSKNIKQKNLKVKVN